MFNSYRVSDNQAKLMFQNFVSLSPTNNIPSAEQCLKFFQKQGIQQKHFTGCGTYQCYTVKRILNWNTFKCPALCDGCLSSIQHSDGSCKYKASLFDIGEQLQRIYLDSQNASLMRAHENHVHVDGETLSAWDGKIYISQRNAVGPDPRCVVLNPSIDGLCNEYAKN